MEYQTYTGAGYKYKHEIIQIGGVLLGENYEPIATICQYVHPEYGVLDNFISKMTGIHNDQIKHAPVIQEALQRLLDWIGDRSTRCLRGAIRIISS